MKRPQFTPEKSCLLAVALSGLIIGAFLLSNLIRSVDNISSFGLCSLASAKARAAADYDATPAQLQSILHYATSKIVPQQSLAEISVTFDVLKTRSPCNFLVFGLGFDSLMWTSLNPHGTTLFLEEDPKWVQTIVKKAPTLNAHTVQYRTQLQEANSLLKTYRSEPLCSPSKAYLRGNYKCKLALTGLPDEVYDKEWDLIMIDAPRGYGYFVERESGTIDEKIIASAMVFTERIEELKKKREESKTLFNELMINIRDVCQERNLLEVRRKIDYVNQWLKERTVVVDETMKEEHNATGFDQSAAPRKDTHWSVFPIILDVGVIGVDRLIKVAEGDEGCDVAAEVLFGAMELHGDEEDVMLLLAAAVSCCIAAAAAAAAV
ncbi:hypothetical protein D5086_007348 [Populus alba]|uniref:Uncharacterized protein n=1 Tax=Populus alba TaxID=43335 RepID=A0ACC4CPC5_POPAL